MSDITLNRQGGLGDILMAFGAAKTLRMAGHKVSLTTQPRYLEAPSTCPYFSDLYVDRWRGIDIGGVQFGCAQEHQTDAYIRWFGIDPSTVPAEYKQTEYRYHDVNIGISNYTLVHPGVYRDGNRGWSHETWQGIIDALVDDGHKVIVLGSAGHMGRKEETFENTAGMVDGGTILEATGIIARARAFISIDSGPVQMAAATEVPIVGLYGITAGEFRAPFRHGQAGWMFRGVQAECPHFPCYKSIRNPENWTNINSQDDINNLFSYYCPAKDYRCLKVDPQQIITALHEMNV